MAIIAIQRAESQELHDVLLAFENENVYYWRCDY